MATISGYHRIQGSTGLNEAAKYIAGVLSSHGVESRIHSFPYGREYGTIEPVVGWNVRSAELWLVKPERRLLRTFARSRTLVVAHSPGGDVEAPVVNVERGEKDEDYAGKDVDGKFVLSHGYTYTVYTKASERGASGVLLYRKELLEDAIPYTGLFLSPEEAARAKALALSIPLGDARRMIENLARGREVVVRAVVEAEYGDAEMSVVEARVEGAEEGAGVDIVAHYCHPAGTANDNASGSAGLLELALAMSRAVAKGRIERPSRRIRFLWYPEYYGSMALLIHEAERPIAAINLDMIGERQDLTGSALMFVRAPHFRTSYVEAILYKELKGAFSTLSPYSGVQKALSVRFSPIDYGSGSDHDIYLDIGVPAYMVFQWPDKFYHSDLDTVDKVDPYMIRTISVAAGTAAYEAVSIGRFPELKTFVYHYFLSLLHGKLGEVAKDRELYELRRAHLTRVFSSVVGALDEELGRLVGAVAPEEKRECERFVRAVKGPLRIRGLAKKLGAEKILWLRDLVSEERAYSLGLFHLVPMLLDEPVSLGELVERIEVEFGCRLDKEKVSRFFDLLSEAGYIRSAAG